MSTYILNEKLNAVIDPVATGVLSMSIDGVASTLLDATSNGLRVSVENTSTQSIPVNGSMSLSAIAASLLDTTSSGLKVSVENLVTQAIPITGSVTVSNALAQAIPVDLTNTAIVVNLPYASNQVWNSTVVASGTTSAGTHVQSPHVSIYGHSNIACTLAIMFSQDDTTFFNSGITIQVTTGPSDFSANLTIGAPYIALQLTSSTSATLSAIISYM